MVRISGTRGDGWVEVSVADGGPGLPPQALDRIFERFYQVDASRPGGVRHGAGLGLAIAREIVHAHGGKITARNLPDSGAIFVVKLPLQL